METVTEEINEEIKEPIKPKINTKDELILNIKEWIKIDNELTKMKIEVKERTNKKKQLTESLVNIMKSNSIDCFDINGGALIYKQKKTRKTISGKFLLEQLEEYYKDKPEIAKEITQKVLDNRVEVIKEEIKRKIDK
jgi:hypothetical protein